MPDLRSPSEQRAAREEASPRVGSVHSSRMCGRCTASTLVTRMRVARRGQHHLFYEARTAGNVETWLCEPCSKALLTYGVLRA